MLVAQGFVGGDPTKLDKHTVLDEPGVGLVFDVQHPDATAIQIDTLNDHQADTMVTNWVNNSEQQVRTTYQNEKGELRTQPGSPATVGVRNKQRNAGQTGDLEQWTTDGNVPLSAIGPDGQARLAVGPWQDLQLEPGVVADGAGVRLESAYRTGRLRGRLTTQAAGFGAGVPFATLPAGFAPEQDLTMAIRFDTSNRTLTVNAAGQLSIDSSIGAGSDHTIHLDGLTWEVATP